MIEITSRHRRVCIRLATEVTPDISAVFEQKGVGFIFRMSLKEDKQALLGFDECVNAGVRRPREHIVSATCQCFFRNTVPSRMRKSEPRRRARRQQVIRYPGTLENAA